MTEQNRLELNVTEFQKGAVTWNYGELNTALDSALKSYQGVVYDETQITDAKADRARLNKLATALSAKRRELKSEFLEPFTDFENKCKQLETKVKNTSAEIDKQVKEFEDRQKDEKKAAILAKWAELTAGIGAEIPIEPIYESRWVNKTVRLDEVFKILTDEAKRVKEEIHEITKCDKDKYNFVIMRYLESLDFVKSLGAWETEQERLRRAEELNRINEQRRREQAERAAEIARMKAEQAAAVQNNTAVIEEAPKPPVYAVPHTYGAVNPAPETTFPEILHRTLWVEGTKEQIIALGKWLKDNGMKFGKVEM